MSAEAITGADTFSITRWECADCGWTTDSPEDQAHAHTRCLGTSVERTYVAVEVSRNERDWTVHPGETLQELIGERNWTQSWLARETGYTHKHINRVCKGAASITAPLAVRLERTTGVSAQFWMNLQTGHDLHIAREELEDMRYLPSDDAVTGEQNHG